MLQNELSRPRVGLHKSAGAEFGAPEIADHEYENVGQTASLEDFQDRTSRGVFRFVIIAHTELITRIPDNECMNHMGCPGMFLSESLYGWFHLIGTGDRHGIGDKA
jgi:hypothetical protein